jgi:hypothetical protein
MTFEAAGNPVFHQGTTLPATEIPALYQGTTLVLPKKAKNTLG